MGRGPFVTVFEDEFSDLGNEGDVTVGGFGAERGAEEGKRGGHRRGGWGREGEKRSRRESRSCDRSVKRGRGGQVGKMGDNWEGNKDARNGSANTHSRPSDQKAETQFVAPRQTSQSPSILPTQIPSCRLNSSTTSSSQYTRCPRKVCLSFHHSFIFLTHTISRSDSQGLLDRVFPLSDQSLSLRSLFANAQQHSLRVLRVRSIIQHTHSLTHFHYPLLGCHPQSPSSFFPPSFKTLTDCLSTTPLLQPRPFSSRPSISPHPPSFP